MLLFHQKKKEMSQSSGAESFGLFHWAGLDAGYYPIRFFFFLPNFYELIKTL
jgi:hypothetical protein